MNAATLPSIVSFPLVRRLGAPFRSSAVTHAVAGFVEGLEQRTLLSITFASPETINNTLSLPHTVVAADLDHDGDIDVVTTELGNATVQWHENDGTGEFTSHVITTTGAGVTNEALQIADINGDDNLDVVTAEWDGNRIVWYANDGTGQFGTAQTIAPFDTYPGADAVTVGDFDGDGDADVASASPYSGNLNLVAWWENTDPDGNGTTWQMHVLSQDGTTLSGARSVTAADVDGDGDQDLFAAARFSNTIVLFENVGMPGGATEVVFEPRVIANELYAATAVRVGDMDGDGDLDVIGACHAYGGLPPGTNRINWYENVDGQFSVDSTATSPVPVHPVAGEDLGSVWSVEPGDLDQDGDLDLVATGDAAAPSGLFWFENTDGLGTFGAKQAIDTALSQPANSAVADIDGDGALDVLAIAYGGGKLNWYRALLPASISGMVFLDFNDDGAINFNDDGIANWQISLSGTDHLGQAVSLTTSTDADGVYAFEDLAPGTYAISQGAVPAGYDLVDGKEALGTVDGAAVGDLSNDLFSDVAIDFGGEGVNYNFGERPAPGSIADPDQTINLGFWQSKNGQALIKSLNVTTADPNPTQLGDWLAATLPGLFGTGSGQTGSMSNDTTGQTNAYVAALFTKKFKAKGVKLDAQIMATALSVYATTEGLAGTTAAGYGLAVTSLGLGYSTWNVGSSGVAFGVADNSSLTVLQLLKAADDRYDLWTSQSMISEANRVFEGINNW